MRRIGWKHKAQILLVAAATIVGLDGLAPEAKAFQFNNGDLVLAIYGNNTEFYYDLGQQSSLLASGSLRTIDISALPGSPFAPGSGVIGGPQTQWTIIGRNQVSASPAANGIFVYAGSQNDAANITITPSISANNSRIQGWNSFLNGSTGMSPNGEGAQVFLNSTDPAAFSNSNNFGLDGTLGGSWNGAGMQGSVGDLLSLLQGQARSGPISGPGIQTNIISDAGRAMLALNGQLTICGGASCSVAAVPIPTAVVLFASGLIGLVGLARRKFTDRTA